MALIAVEGCRICFECDAGWSWKGWDGKLTVRRGSGQTTAGGHRLVLFPDVIALQAQFAGHQYAAQGYEDTPGGVASALISVEGESLSPTLSDEGAPAVTAKTKGSFQVSCTPPSFRAGSPPVPDPLASMHTGKWRVEDPAQGLVGDDV